MNERMTDLLDLASSDDGAPLGISGASVVRRARRSRHRRQGGVAVGAAAAAVAAVVALTQLTGSGSDTAVAPADGGTLTATPQAPSPSPSGSTSLSPHDQAIVDACARQHLPADVVHVPSGQGGFHQPQRGDTIQDTSTAGPRASFLQGWALDASVTDDLGITATFVSPDHTRWASCDIAAGGTRDADGVWTAPLPTGPVPQSWYGPEGFRHQGLTVSWSEVCAPGEGKVCSHELFAGTLVRYAGVASARVEAPDGTVVTPVFGRYTYVFRHAETRVDPHRAADDEQPLPSMPVTLLDAAGRQIIRYDFFPSYVVPSGCPSTGGC